MKILTSIQTREADKHEIEHEKIASIELMERASEACAVKIESLFPLDRVFSIFCGTGNNGGDGLAIARLLANRKRRVTVYAIRVSSTASEDFKANFERLIKEKTVKIIHVNRADQFLKTPPHGVIIDCLFGTGLNKALSGLALSTVQAINDANLMTISIDLPSGLFADKDNIGQIEGIVKANYTLTFESPKLSFFFPSAGPYVGKWFVLDIGINKNFMQSLECKSYVIDTALICSIRKKRAPFAHKGNFGHSLIIAGSKGKMGAAVLSSKACLRAGAGLVTAFIPFCGHDILQASIPEVMVLSGDDENCVSGRPALKSYKSVGIGPGLGKNNKSKKVLVFALEKTICPLVLDADALNLLAEHLLLNLVPKNSILTPHVKEFDRLFGESVNYQERLQKQRKASIEHGFFIVLKGRHSAVSTPNGDIYFNNTGNPGMATAGSGDVLTGIITGLLSQGYQPFESSILGVHLHGLAGDSYTENNSQESLISSDIIENLSQAFRIIHNYE